MSKYSHFGQYSGQRVAPLPPGYMETATAPGRNLAAGIASVGEDIGDAIKQHKDEAKAAKSLRQLIGIYQPDMKDQAETMSKSELEGAVRGFVMKQETEERAAEEARRAAEFPGRQRGQELQNQQQEAALAEQQRGIQALADFNRTIGSQGADPVAGAAAAMSDPGSGIGLSSLKQFMQQSPQKPRLDPEWIMKAAAEAGVLSPELAANLSQFGTQTSRHQFTAQDMGVARPIPGIPNKFFVPSSTGGGQIVDAGSQASGEWQEQFLPDGSPTGWAIASDGSMRRLRDQRDVVGAEKYDIDGDGIISQEEFQQAVIAEKFGGVYPGMQVGSGSAPAQDRPVSPSDAYNTWKSQR